MVALNSLGVAAGKMLAPQSIAIGLVSVNESGKDGELLKKVRLTQCCIWCSWPSSLISDFRCSIHCIYFPEMKHGQMIVLFLKLSAALEASIICRRNKDAGTAHQ